MTAEPAVTNDGTQYSYRGALVGSGWHFKLTENGIDWSTGTRSGHVAFENIRRIRMRFRPMNMQANRYVTELWADGAPKLTIVSTTLKGLFDQPRLDTEYTAFVRELHRRVAASGAVARCTRGNHPLLYGPAVVLYVAILLGLAILAVRAVQSDVKAAALFIVAFAGLFAWQGGNFLRRNRPGLYRADAPPAELLPGSPRTTSTEHLA